MCNAPESNQWYAHWFDSSFYHLLYQHRDPQEATQFINELMCFLAPSKGARILDLACGKGRHARAMHAHGYNITGVDLSLQSIEAARKELPQGLHFDVHDMRDVYRPKAFELVVSLFTSFGYFADPADDQRVLNSVAAALVPGGRFVLDFMNADYVTRKLVPSEEIVRGNITFRIQRTVVDGMIHKNIAFQAGGHSYNFQEHVRAYNLEGLSALFTNAGFKVCKTFGSYRLEGFDAAQSDRLIVVGQLG